MRTASSSCHDRKRNVWLRLWFFPYFFFYQVSKFSFDPGHGFKREAQRSWAESDPSDEPLYLVHHEEPQRGALQLSTKQPGQCQSGRNRHAYVPLSFCYGSACMLSHPCVELHFLVSNSTVVETLTNSGKSPTCVQSFKDGCCSSVTVSPLFCFAPPWTTLTLSLVTRQVHCSHLSLSFNPTLTWLLRRFP